MLVPARWDTQAQGARIHEMRHTLRKHRARTSVGRPRSGLTLAAQGQSKALPVPVLYDMQSCVTNNVIVDG